MKIYILSERFQWGETDVEVVSATILYKLKWTLLTVDMSVACTIGMLLLLTPFFYFGFLVQLFTHNLMYFMPKPSYILCKSSTKALHSFPAHLLLKCSLSGQARMDGSDVLWSLPRDLPTLVHPPFIEKGLKLGVGGRYLSECVAHQRGYMIHNNNRTLELRMPFGAEGGFIKVHLHLLFH